MPESVHALVFGISEESEQVCEQVLGCLCPKNILCNDIQLLHSLMINFE